MEMGVICDEIINYVRRLVTEIEISDDTLAVDLIRKIGPGGHYLAEQHTRTYLHRGEMLHPKLFNRQAIADWKVKGQRSARDEANLKVRSILHDHRVAPLSKETTDQIQQILKQASQQMVPTNT